MSSRSETVSSDSERELHRVSVSGSRRHVPNDCSHPQRLARIVHRGGRLKAIRGLLIVFTIASSLGTSALRADTIRVPADYSTIQSAIDAAKPDDTILVSPGVYDENLYTFGKRLTLISEAGAEATIVDGGFRGTVLFFNGGGLVDGFTFRRGHHPTTGGGLGVGAVPGTIIRNNIIEENSVGSFDSGLGGGIMIAYGAPQPAVVVENNKIRNNYAGDSGGGIYNLGEYTEIRGNLISDNGCHVCGGGVWLGGSIFRENLVLNNWADSFGGGVCGGGVEISNNTVVGNFTNNFPATAGIHVDQGLALITNNIVANNNGDGIRCSDPQGPPTPRVECNDSWGNSGSNYTIYSSCDSTTGRNFSADPLFCGAALGDFRISELSPCSPSSPLNAGCGLIGALGVGCGTTAAEEHPSPTARSFQILRNPANGTAEFEVMPVPAQVLEIYEASGRLIERQRLLDGASRATWQPRDSTPPGVYFAALRSGNETSFVKFILLRH